MEGDSSTPSKGRPNVVKEVYSGRGGGGGAVTVTM